MGAVDEMLKSFRDYEQRDDEERRVLTLALRKLAAWAEKEAAALQSRKYSVYDVRGSWVLHRDKIERLTRGGRRSGARKLGRPQSVVNEEEICQAADAGVPIARLAREHGVSRPTIYRVIERRRPTPTSGSQGTTGKRL